MKISEQIQYLQKMLEENGDMEMVIRTPSEHYIGDSWYYRFTPNHMYTDDMVKCEFNEYKFTRLDKVENAEKVLVITSED